MGVDSSFAHVYSVAPYPVQYLSSAKDLARPFNQHKQNIEFFLSELNDVGSQNPTLIAFGNEVYDILNRNIRDKFKILKVPHYANYTSKEKYRQQVKEIYKKDN